VQVRIDDASAVTLFGQVMTADRIGSSV